MFIRVHTFVNAIKRLEVKKKFISARGLLRIFYVTVNVIRILQMFASLNFT